MDSALYGPLPNKVVNAQNARAENGQGLLKGDANKYSKSLRAFYGTTPVLNRFWTRSIHTRKKWERARRRRQFFDSLILRLAPNREDIILFGDAFKGQNLQKGHYRKATDRRIPKASGEDSTCSAHTGVEYICHTFCVWWEYRPHAAMAVSEKLFRSGTEAMEFEGRSRRYTYTHFEYR